MNRLRPTIVLCIAVCACHPPPARESPSHQRAAARRAPTKINRPAGQPRRSPARLTARPPAPPPGIPGEFVDEFVTGIFRRGSYGCPAAPLHCRNGRCRTTPRLHVYYRKPVRVLDPVTICFAGAQGGAPVRVEIVAPGGARRRFHVPPQSGGSIRIESLLPRGAPGRYRIRASAGTRALVHALQATPARQASISITPAQSLPGDTLRIGIKGHPPHTRFALHVYHRLGQIPEHKGKLDRTLYRYMATLRLRTDTHGLADAPLLTRRDAPVGQYALAFKPGVWRGGFELDPPPKK